MGSSCAIRTSKLSSAFIRAEQLWKKIAEHEKKPQSFKLDQLLNTHKHKNELILSVKRTLSPAVLRIEHSKKLSKLRKNLSFYNNQAYFYYTVARHDNSLRACEKFPGKSNSTTAVHCQTPRGLKSCCARADFSIFPPRGGNQS